MKLRQIPITIVCTIVLTLFVIQIMQSLNDDNIAVHSIAYFIVSSLTWKAILPRRNVLDIAFCEGIMFPMLVFTAGAWSAVNTVGSFSQTLSQYAVFMTGFVTTWIILHLMADTILSVFAEESTKEEKVKTS